MLPSALRGGTTRTLGCQQGIHSARRLRSRLGRTTAAAMTEPPPLPSLPSPPGLPRSAPLSPKGLKGPSTPLKLPLPPRPAATDSAVPCSSSSSSGSRLVVVVVVQVVVVVLIISCRCHRIMLLSIRPGWYTPSPLLQRGPRPHPAVVLAALPTQLRASKSPGQRLRAARRLGFMSFRTWGSLGQCVGQRLTSGPAPVRSTRKAASAAARRGPAHSRVGQAGPKGR
jgi:hypothetical protein